MNTVLIIIAVVLFAVAALIPLAGRGGVRIDLVAAGLAFFALAHIVAGDL